MPLTPEDVSNKRFTAVRLREGYDMGEVDQFLDEVEAELSRLTAENEELRAKLESAGGESPPKPSLEKQPEPEKKPEEEPAAAQEPEPEPEPEPAEEPQRSEQTAGSGSRGEVETIQVTTTAEASRAATRLLELAGRNADELVAEAQQEADEILGAARAEAEQAQAEARQQAEALEAENAERRQQLMGDLESERVRLDEEVTRLKQFEQTYRQQLRDYFQVQLSALDGEARPASLNGEGRSASDSGGSHEAHSES